MKKLLFIAGVFFVTSGVFAIDKNKEEEKEAPKKEKAESQCCTAYLTYNGEIKDHVEVCGMITTGDNCRMAGNLLILKHPDKGLKLPEGQE